MFRDGDDYEGWFDTPAGQVQVLARVRITGRRLELHDVAVFGVGPEPLPVGARVLLRMIRADAERALRIFDRYCSGSRSEDPGGGRAGEVGAAE